jgi:hypothetical protein
MVEASIFRSQNREMDQLQGDQLGQLFAHWAAFLMTEVDQIFDLVFSPSEK